MAVVYVVLHQSGCPGRQVQLFIVQVIQDAAIRLNPEMGRRLMHGWLSLSWVVIHMAGVASLTNVEVNLMHLLDLGWLAYNVSKVPVYK